ncbi:MAG TPA: aminoglycoside phosphotransferase family protein [Acidimicrobiia bacterium]|nr:aminoglycoside phosphotransferase family protein [Acidimicrobiia bacterium]
MAAPTPNIVTDPADVGPSWLTDVLRGSGHDVTVVAVDREPVGTGQMAHNERFRLVYEGDANGAPKSVVGKFPSPSDMSRAAGAAGGYRNEVRFYTDLAERLAVRTPHCFYGTVNDTSTEFTLILEDLAPARQGDQIEGCTPEQLIEAAVNLGGLHASMWCDPALRDLDWIGSAVGDQTVMIVQLFVPMFLERYADRLSPVAKKVLERFGAGVETWLASEPERFTVVHGDYRLDNLMFGEPGSEDPVAAVDWQTISIGCGGRDLAYLLGTSVDPLVRREVESDVRSAYRARLRDLGVADYSPADLEVDERHGSFQGPFITMLGAIAVGQTDRGDDMFMAMAERSVAQVVDLDALDLLD